MYIYGDYVSGNIPTYDALMTYEPDGITPIAPDTYDGVEADYTDYDDIVANISGDPTVDKIVRVDTTTGKQTIVRGSMGAPVMRGKFIVVDSEAPLNDEFHYVVYLSTGAVHRTAGCQVPSNRWPGVMDHCVPVLFSDPLVVRDMQWASLLSIDPLSYPARSSLKDVLNRHAPVALSGVRSTARTTFTVLTRTLDERRRLLDLFMPGRILLYRNPNPGYPENNWYIAVGEVTESRVHPDHARPERKWSIEVAVVDRPLGLLAAAEDRTYMDLRDYEPDGTTPIVPDNYKGVYDDYADYLTALLGGPGGGQSVTSRVASRDLIYQGGATSVTSKANAGSWSLLP
jgi:hypothetical protein